jgi:hypothetical protein
MLKETHPRGGPTALTTALNGVGGVGGVGGPPELTNATDTTNVNGHLSIGVGDLLDPVMFDEW